MTVSIAIQSRVPGLHQLLLFMVGILMLIAGGWLQADLDQRQDQILRQIEELAQLPTGEYLKPALLGYHHLGADMFWLRLLQVIGKKRNSEEEYEWIYHALDVITTLDPQYSYAYYVGGNILGDLAKRPDLSNRLLEKGAEANPEVWYIPFLLGYNHYFLLGDPSKGAEYTMQAAALPDRPAYLPGLATRLAAEAGNPDTALAFLEARIQETQDPGMRQSFVNRMREVIIEKDLRTLENAVQTYLTYRRALPMTLGELITAGILPMLPEEPFGGTYQLDSESGAVSSSTHPNRLRTFFRRKQQTLLLPKIEPSYVFPRVWE